MLNVIKTKCAALIASWSAVPSLRYKILLPLQRLVSMDADEEMLMRAFSFAGHNSPDGDYLEFGVWKGRSFVKAFHMLDTFIRGKKGQLKNMRFFAFDSFEGLPKPTTIEDMSTGEFKKGDYMFDRNSFEHVLAQKHVSKERVCIVPGWFNESLTDRVKAGFSLRKAAVVWIDCDLYESTVPVLKFIEDIIVDGTIIIFDDWYCFQGRSDRGEQKAMAEWLERNSGIRAIPWHSPSWKAQAFILNKK